MQSTFTAAERRNRLTGFVCAVLVVMFWTGFSLTSRYSARAGIGLGLTPWDLGFLRFGVAGVLASGLWLAGFGRGLVWWRGLVLAVMAGFGFALPSYVGFRFAPAAHGALILSGTLPFLVALGSWAVFGGRFGRWRWLSLVLLFVGLGLFSTEAYWRGQAPPGAWRGDLLFLLGSVSWAIYTILARRWGPTPTQSIVTVGLWCGVLFVPVWWLVLPSRLAAAPPMEVLLQAVFHGFIAVVLSLWLYTRAMASLGAQRLTTFTALVPGLAAVLAVVLLGEPLGWLAAAGLALVCVAVLLGMREA